MKIIDFALYIGKLNDEIDFQPAKLYPVIEPLNNDSKDYLRVVDESGEDYLYPRENFQIVELNTETQVNLKEHFELALV